jgi:hypothetical protein
MVRHWLALCAAAGEDFGVGYGFAVKYHLPHKKYANYILTLQIGPARMFSGDATYKNLQFFWLAGAAAPVMIYFAAKQWPKSPIKFLSAPLIVGGTGQIPPATPLNYLSWGVVGFIFNKWIRNRYRGWW